MATCGKVLVKILQNYGIDTAFYEERYGLRAKMSG